MYSLMEGIEKYKILIKYSLLSELPLCCASVYIFGALLISRSLRWAANSAKIQ